jgi:hypothetical protein
MTDKKAEAEGTWTDIDGVRFLIARAGGANKAYINCVAKLAQPHATAFRLETPETREIAEEITRKAYSKHVVLAWDGVDENDLLAEDAVPAADPKPLPFSPENCLALFKAQPDLFVDIMEVATKLKAYRLADREAAAKNS